MIRIVRVGGSLLTWKRFPAAFHHWLARQPPAANVLIAGGGPWVELLRQAAHRFEIDEQTAHWQSVRAMRITAELLGSILRVDVVSDRDALVASRQVMVLDVYSLLKEDAAQGGNALPASWDVTSDSIAARLAEALTADELVLLKSCHVPATAASPAALSQAGIVDPWFPTAARGIQRIRCLNLRGISDAAV